MCVCILLIFPIIAEEYRWMDGWMDISNKLIKVLSLLRLAQEKEITELKHRFFLKPD